MAARGGWGPQWRARRVHHSEKGFLFPVVEGNVTGTSTKRNRKR